MMGCGIRSFEPQGSVSCYYRPSELRNFTVARQLVTEKKSANRKILRVPLLEIFRYYDIWHRIYT
jgi:hypothetical protein